MKRKDKQLARQAERALSFAIAEIAGAEGALVLSAEPAPDASRLVVTIRAPPDVPVQRVEEAIARASGFLRSAVAEAITRKKAPTLVYFLVP